MPKEAPSRQAQMAAIKKATALAKSAKRIQTIEVDAYLHGLYQEFQAQAEHYRQLTHQLLSIEARAEIAEKNLRLTRDHLAMSVEKAKAVTIPKDWTRTLNSVQFVGMRLADACVTLLRERKAMTPEEIFLELNLGMFRFRTSAPLREIHGALLRHPFIKRVEGNWVWTDAGDQMSMHLRVVQSEPVVEQVETTEDEPEGKLK